MSETGPYSDLADPDNWRTFDLAAAAPLSGQGFRGGAYDGRYVYFAPYPGGTVARYDTKAAFGAPSSWSGIALHGVFPGGVGYVGAAIANGGLYLAPYAVEGVRFSGEAVRHDLRADFAEPSSWALFEANSAPGGAGALGYTGLTAGERYVYYAPYSNGAHHGIVARHDAQGGFAEAAAWSYHDAAAAIPNAVGFVGALHANGFVYFVPFNNGVTSHGLVLRYREAAAFNALTSWTSFDVSSLFAQAKGFVGGAFDGKYVYLVPNTGSNDFSGLAVRYDSEASFEAGTSWSSFDIATLDAVKGRGFSGGAFDGRYVYYVAATVTSGTIYRYDTTLPFTEAGSWGSFDITPLNADARAFYGAVFDGEFIYFIPASTGVVARFRARQEKVALPPFYRGGSFF